jgi:CheY-like chemotaxis protein
MVRADRTRLKQALVNLLSNAIKYNLPRGKVTLEVMARDEVLVRIGVTDTGPGISLERQMHLFQPFNRLGAERTEVEGTGIGLVISRRLVDMMGGRIGVETTPGEGSTFWVELPAAELVQDAVAHLTDEARRPEVAETSAERIVLYVEDNPANVRLVSQLFARRPRVHLFTAHTPSLGLDLAVARQPDLVLLDINLPGMDGYEVLQRLRALPGMAQVPVLAVTANAMPRDVERGLAAGFSDYLTKPLDVTHFFEVVDRFLAAGHGLHRQQE